MQNPEKVPEDVAKPRQGSAVWLQRPEAKQAQWQQILDGWQGDSQEQLQVDLDSRGHGGKRISMGPMGYSFLSKLCIHGLCDLRWVTAHLWPHFLFLQNEGFGFDLSRIPGRGIMIRGRADAEWVDKQPGASQSISQWDLALISGKTPEIPNLENAVGEVFKPWSTSSDAQISDTQKLEAKLSWN